MRTQPVVLLSLCLLSLLTACASERVVEKPVVVEVIKKERVPIPEDFVKQHPKTEIPEGVVSYADAIQLWASDRAIIDTQNGQLEAIKSLNVDLAAHDESLGN